VKKLLFFQPSSSIYVSIIFQNNFPLADEIDTGLYPSVWWGSLLGFGMGTIECSFHEDGITFEFHRWLKILRRTTCALFDNFLRSMLCTLSFPGLTSFRYETANDNSSNVKSSSRVFRSVDELATGTNVTPSNSTKGGEYFSKSSSEQSTVETIF